MAEIKTGPKEAVVLGFLTIALLSVGVALMANSPLDVMGRSVPPDPLLAIVAGIGSAAGLVASFVFAVRAHGSKEGAKLVLGNMAAGLIVAGAGAVIGFALRALFGPMAILMMIVLWAVGLYVTFWYSKKLETRA